MKKFHEFCVRVKVIAAEVASLAFFLLILYVALRYEITHVIANSGH